MSIDLPQRRKAEPSHLTTLERSKRTNSYERNLEKLKDPTKDQHEYENLVDTKVKPARKHAPLPAIPEKPMRNPRSKRNQIYQSVAQQDEFETCGVTRRKQVGAQRRHTCVVLMLLAAFVLILTELGYVFIVWKGVLDIPIRCGGACSENDVTAPPTNSELATKQLRELRSVLSGVRDRATRLEAAVKEVNKKSERLLRRYSNFTEKIANLERDYTELSRRRTVVFRDEAVGVAGPPGPTGETGEPGRRGLTGDLHNSSLSLCFYERKTSAPFTAGRFSGQDVVVREAEGMRIVGAACSTSGTTEYNLYSFVHKGVRFYKCWCKGRSDLFPNHGAEPGKSDCSIQYLSCPTLK